MKFEAGTYYVGDPCYVYDNASDGWDKILFKTDFFRNIPADLEGKIWAANTEWGDGEYHDERGRAYGVDAGLIGIVHPDLCECDHNGGGHIITFDHPFECYTEGSVIIIGDIEIDTDPQENDCWGCGEPIDYCTCFEDDESEGEY